jgi:hypothetical protein
LKRNDYPVPRVLERLQLMKAEAIFAVVARLCKALVQIKAKEVKGALENPLKAAAQYRIILPNVSQDVTESVFQWVYFNNLQFVDANHLCNLYSSAKQLDLRELADRCLATLSTAANTTIDRAQAEGVSLLDLLNGLPAAASSTIPENYDPLSDVVGTIFRYVLPQKHPSTVLKTFVIEAIADSANPDLVGTLLQSMAVDSEMKDELCMAFSNRLCKLNNVLTQKNLSWYWKESSDDSLKSETEIKQDDGNASMKMPTDNVFNHHDVSRDLQSGEKIPGY